ncbi:MAG: ABC transporter ATP-binding protein [Tepidanaerobacter acetatoxydans]|uniref:ABC transporter ATP-binding protein n=1 Tax=Tepidanaerobacter acetatoxydans TaxID=499229 RepID=UPI0026F367CD|nr:ABC transporter ATP-binding protein [Tepidanaerobacter acetatoxydans]NLU10047.1 ABC transporter ATP-binding protein [Tepidanaerobacter acetatoxydans]
MVILDHIQKIFYRNTPNENQVLNNLSLKVEDGDFITVIGSNGAGKSTMLNVVAGVHPVDSGSIVLDGIDITHLPEFRRAAFIGRVFQDPMLGTSPSMTIEENLSMAYARPNNMTLRWGLDFQRRKIFKDYLKNIPLGLENRLSTKVKLLSGGQRQALTLIMATMKKPKLLLLDEHTAALDPKTAQMVNSLTEEIVQKNNITTIMVTHNLEHAIKMGNRLIMMHKGQIVMDLSGEEKSTMTIPRLLNKFEQLQGEKFVEDRVMLA